jgi:hypothetical protein
MFGQGGLAVTAQPKGIQWVPMRNGQHPAYAVQAGVDAGNPLFVARAFHNGGMIPGKLHQGHSSAYVGFGGKEFPKPEYEVIISTFCLTV